MIMSSRKTRNLQSLEFRNHNPIYGTLIKTILFMNYDLLQIVMSSQCIEMPCVLFAMQQAEVISFSLRLGITSVASRCWCQTLWGILSGNHLELEIWNVVLQYYTKLGIVVNLHCFRLRKTRNSAGETQDVSFNYCHITRYPDVSRWPDIWRLIPRQE